MKHPLLGFVCRAADAAVVILLIITMIVTIIITTTMATIVIILTTTIITTATIVIIVVITVVTIINDNKVAFQLTMSYLHAGQVLSSSGTCILVCSCSVINRCSPTPGYTQSQSQTQLAGVQRHVSCRNALWILRGTHD